MPVLISLLSSFLTGTVFVLFFYLLLILEGMSRVCLSAYVSGSWISDLMVLSKTFETNQCRRWEGEGINAIKQRHLITALERKDYSP